MSRSHDLLWRRAGTLATLAVLATLAPAPAVMAAGNKHGGAPPIARIEPLPLGKLMSAPARPIGEAPDFQVIERQVPLHTQRLSLDDLRRTILEHQLEIRVERIAPAIAAEAVTQEEARFNAVFGASVTRSKTEDFSNVIQRGRNVTIGTSIPLRTGGALSLSMPVDSLSEPTTISSASASLSLSQPLLRNGGLRVNTAGIEQARLSSEQARAGAKLAVINYLSIADRLYWQHWASWQEVDVRYEQYDMAKKQVDYAEQTVAAGLIAKVDVIRSQSGVARRIEDILVAESARRQIEREMKRVMNRDDLPLDGATTLVPADEPQLVELALQPARVLDQAYGNRTDLLAAQIQLARDALERDVADNQLLPSLSLNLGYTMKNYDPAATEAVQGLRPGRFPDYSLGLTLEMPFDNSGARARARRAALQQAANLDNLALRKRQIHKDVLDTLEQLDASWQRILAARNEIRTANAIYNAELEQFKHGFRTSTDVLNAAQLIADAKVRNIRAMRDYELAKVDVAYATGTTLGYTGVEIAPYRLGE